MDSVPFTKVQSWLTAQLNYHEGYSNGHYNNIQKFSAMVPGLAWSNGEAWCCTFTSAAFYVNGQSVPSGVLSADCSSSLAAWRRAGKSGDTPRLGAQVFYGPGGGSHTGIVVRYDNDYIWAIEGNTNNSGSAEGDGVYLKQRRRRDAYVYAYGYPDYAPEGSSPTPANPAPAVPSGTPIVYCGQLSHAAAWDPPAAQGHRSYCWQQVMVVEKALQREGLLASNLVDGSWGTSTIQAYAAWQRRCGYTGTDADGKPGMASLTKLGNKYGFRVGA